MRKRFLPLRVDFRFDSVEKVLATGDRTFVKWAVVPLLPLFLLNLEQKMDLADRIEKVKGFKLLVIKTTMKSK
jgi:hypothetical protein